MWNFKGFGKINSFDELDDYIIDNYTKIVFMTHPDFNTHRETQRNAILAGTALAFVENYIITPEDLIITDSELMKKADVLATSFASCLLERLVIDLYFTKDLMKNMFISKLQIVRSKNSLLYKLLTKDTNRMVSKDVLDIITNKENYDFSDIYIKLVK